MAKKYSNIEEVLKEEAFKASLPLGRLEKLTHKQALAFLLWWFGLTEREATSIMKIDRSTYHESLKGRVYKQRKCKSKGAFGRLGLRYKKYVSPIGKRKPGTKWLYIEFPKEKV